MKNECCEVRYEGKRAIIGLKKEVVATLEPLEAIQLPSLGAFLHKGDILAIIESSKAATEVLSPISGKVLKVNEKLLDNVHLLSSSFDEGWICHMEIKKS